MTRFSLCILLSPTLPGVLTLPAEAQERSVTLMGQTLTFELPSRYRYGGKLFGKESGIPRDMAWFSAGKGEEIVIGLGEYPTEIANTYPLEDGAELTIYESTQLQKWKCTYSDAVIVIMFGKEVCGANCVIDITYVLEALPGRIDLDTISVLEKRLVELSQHWIGELQLECRNTF